MSNTAKPLPAVEQSGRVSAKEAHRKIRELTEAVSRGHRVRQTVREPETKRPSSSSSANLQPVR